MTNTLKKITCPHCQKENTWTPENKFRPFCSERCSLLDLGNWASEVNRLPVSDEQPQQNPDEEIH